MQARRVGAGGLRRSSQRITGRKARKVGPKQWNLESCLQLLRGVVVDGWLSVLSACRPKALQATPLQSLVKRGSSAVAATTERNPPASSRRIDSYRNLRLTASRWLTAKERAMRFIRAMLARIRSM